MYHTILYGASWEDAVPPVPEAVAAEELVPVVAAFVAAEELPPLLHDASATSAATPIAAKANRRFKFTIFLSRLL
jgi:hypothetical protein